MEAHYSGVRRRTPESFATLRQLLKPHSQPLEFPDRPQLPGRTDKGRTAEPTGAHPGAIGKLACHIVRITHRFLLKTWPKPTEYRESTGSDGRGSELRYRARRRTLLDRADQQVARFLNLHVGARGWVALEV